MILTEVGQRIIWGQW